MCQTSAAVVQDGRRESDVVPEYRENPALEKKNLYMDEAISKTNFGLFNWILIYVSGTILNATALETVGITYILPVSECDLNLTTSEKGVLASVHLIGIICSSHLWGYLADTKGRRFVIHPTLIVAFLLSVAASFVQSFYVFATLRFLNGFFISGGSATIYAYLSEFHSSAQRGRAIMISSVIYSASGIFLPLGASNIINQDWHFDVPLIGITYKPWRLFLVVCSLPALVSFIIISFLPESPKFVLGQGKQAEAYKILQRMNRMNNGRKASLEMFEIYEESESIENRQRILDCKKSRFPLITSVWNQTVPLFKSPYLKSTLLICSIQFLVFNTCYGMFMFFADILNRMYQNLDDVSSQRAMMCDVINMKVTQLNSTNIAASDMCSTKFELETFEQGFIMEVLYGGSLIVIGLIINKVGLFSILFVSIVFHGTCAIVCMLTNIPLLQISAFVGLMLSCIPPNLVNAATVEIYPTSSRAMAVCISLMFGRLGTVAGSNITALLLDNHCETLFYLSGLTLIGAALLILFIPRNELVKPEKILLSPEVSIITTATITA